MVGRIKAHTEISCNFLSLCVMFVEKLHIIGHRNTILLEHFLSLPLLDSNGKSLPTPSILKPWSLGPAKLYFPWDLMVGSQKLFNLWLPEMAPKQPLWQLGITKMQHTLATCLFWHAPSTPGADYADSVLSGDSFMPGETPVGHLDQH